MKDGPKDEEKGPGLALEFDDAEQTEINQDPLADAPSAEGNEPTVRLQPSATRDSFDLL